MTNPKGKAALIWILGEYGEVTMTIITMAIATMVIATMAIIVSLNVQILGVTGLMQQCMI